MTASQTVTATRLGVAASLLGLDVSSMIEHLVDVSGSFAGAMAFTDADLRTFAIGVDIPTDQWVARRMASLATGVSGSKALARAAIARPGAIWIERGLGEGGPAGEGMAGVHATLAIVGPATLADDLAVAAAVGVDAATCTALGARLGALGGDDSRRDRLVRITIYSGSAPDDMTIELGALAPPDILDRVIREAAALEIGAPQLKLLGRVHPILAAAPPIWVRAGARTNRLEPGATLAYGGATLDTCLRVVSGLASRDDAATRFGAFVGALAVDRARAIELVLGPRDPMPARFGVVVSG